MPAPYEKIQKKLKLTPKTWLITGVAGFIGSNLLETLFKLDQIVIGPDNFSTGYQYNTKCAKQSRRISGTVFYLLRAISATQRHLPGSMSGVDYVLHEAALGSVPRSIEDPNQCQ